LTKKTYFRPYISHWAQLKTKLLEQNIQKFISTRSNYDNFRLKLTELIKELIIDSGIDIVSIESRTKSIESFREKIQRPEKNYDNPFQQITDLCGIRIITYYTEDIYKIAELIKNEFEIDEENSVDKTIINSPDRFGYLSLHYVLKLNEIRKNLIEWKAFNDFNAEIQIRTILQHSWAAIDHKLRYKIKKEIPSTLKRKIFRLSALLELADEEFLSIKNQTQQLHSEIGSSIEKGNLEIEFNSISVLSYIDDNNLIDDIVKMAIDLGYNQITNDIFNDVSRGDYITRLVATLDNSSLNSIRELDNFLNSNFQSIKGKLKSLKEVFYDISDNEIFAIKSDLIMILLVLSKEAKVDINNPNLRNIITWQTLLDCFDYVNNKD